MLYIHKFNNIVEANQAIDLINQGEGIPLENSSTLTYTEAIINNDCCYILADEITIKYLGNPIEFEDDKLTD